ncbi:MAG: J domain-containing protein [Alphaproteobacteria bacterium]|nr:J domain-containing protein [Alphaproteobacteria bacterium]
MPPFDPYADYDDRPVKLRGCNSPGCAGVGDYRAPKNRDLTEYYWFCLEHVREYNSQWDYFAGMSSAEIESHIRKAAVWDRPSWPLGAAKVQEQNLRDHVMREFFGEDGPSQAAAPPMSKVERDALDALELKPPVNFAMVKTQYRALVKRHHPDANGGSREAEEKFKNINQAFAVLKSLYEEETAA